MRYVTRTILLAGLLLSCGARAQSPDAAAPDAVAAPGVELRAISGNGPELGSANPSLSIGADGKTIGIGWRLFSLPVAADAAKGARTAECYASVSRDGGVTFQTVNIMDMVRTPAMPATERTPAWPELYFCDSPFAVAGRDGAIHAGGSVFTPGGVPLQGRVMVTMSRNGRQWTAGLPALSVQNLAFGLAGPNGGTAPEDTPWRSARGFADPQTGIFFAAADGYVASGRTDARGFDAARAPAADKDWPGLKTPEGNSDFAAAFDHIGAVYVASAAPGRTCPCLVFATGRSRDITMTRSVIADATQWHADDDFAPRIAADPAHAGRFAVTAWSADHRHVRVFFTTDAGRTWAAAETRDPSAGNATVARADIAGIGYTVDGRILTTWRGFRAAGAQDLYAAMMTANDSGNAFGPSVKITAEASVYPAATQTGDTGPGGGDTSTGIAGDARFAHIVFPWSPGGTAQRVYYARVPLDMLR